MSQAGSVTSEATGNRLLRHIGALLPRVDAHRLEFGIKTAIAVLIAVAIEFWFALGAVGSAAITVLIVQSNLLGTTFEKSVLRMIGNLIGCSIGLVFLSLFDQDRIAGAIFFTVYSVFCCYHLQRSRFAPGWHWAYNSAGIVFLFHISSPTESFTYTAERWLEISLGIAAMTVVSSVLWPTRAGKVFERQFTAMLANLAGSIAESRAALLSPNGSKQPATPGNLAPGNLAHGNLTPGKLLEGLSSLRDSLHTASRDTSRYQRFHDGYDSLVSGLQSLVARSTLLASAVSNLEVTKDDPVRKADCELVFAALDQLQALLDTLVDISKQHFDEPSARQHALDTAPVRSTVQQIDGGFKTSVFSFRDASALLYVCERITSVADELDRFTDELVNVEQNSNTRSKLSAVQQLDSDNTPFWMRVDVRKSLVCGLIIGLGFAVWIVTNWPSGSVAVFFALLVTSKNCTAPYLPPKAMLPGTALAVFIGAMIYLGVFPQLDGFWQLAVVLFSFYTICGYLMQSPGTTVRSMAATTAVFATIVLSLDERQSYSWGHVVGMAYAILGGQSLAFIVLTCAWPTIPEKMFTSQVKGLFQSCSQRLSAFESNTATKSKSGAAFASASLKQLGRCRLWSSLINYTRLAPKGNEAITVVIGSMQAAVLHLIELEDARQRWSETPVPTPLRDIAQRLNRQCSQVFEGFVRALDRAEPSPELPPYEGLLHDLHEAFDKLRENGLDDEPSRAAARKILDMAGQYAALTRSIAECDAALRKLDWSKLNRSYF